MKAAPRPHYAPPSIFIKVLLAALLPQVLFAIAVLAFDAPDWAGARGAVAHVCWFLATMAGLNLAYRAGRQHAGTGQTHE